MKHIERSVKAHLDRNGMVIYKLLQGQTKPKTMHVFGYGTNTKVWLKFDGLGSPAVTMSALAPHFVKEQIASWVK